MNATHKPSTMAAVLLRMNSSELARPCEVVSRDVCGAQADWLIWTANDDQGDSGHRFACDGHKNHVEQCWNDALGHTRIGVLADYFRAIRL